MGVSFGEKVSFYGFWTAAWVNSIKTDAYIVIKKICPTGPSHFGNSIKIDCFHERAEADARAGPSAVLSARTVEGSSPTVALLELVANPDATGDALTLTEVGRDFGVGLHRTAFLGFKGHTCPSKTAVAAEIGFFKAQARDTAARFTVKFTFPSHTGVRTEALITRVTDFCGQAHSVRLHRVKVELVSRNLHFLAFQVVPEVRGAKIQVELIGHVPTVPCRGMSGIVERIGIVACRLTGQARKTRVGVVRGDNTHMSRGFSIKTREQALRHIVLTD